MAKDERPIGLPISVKELNTLHTKVRQLAHKDVSGILECLNECEEYERVLEQEKRDLDLNRERLLKEKTKTEDTIDKIPVPDGPNPKAILEKKHPLMIAEVNNLIQRLNDHKKTIELYLRKKVKLTAIQTTLTPLMEKTLEVEDAGLEQLVPAIQKKPPSDESMRKKPPSLNPSTPPKPSKRPKRM